METVKTLLAVLKVNAGLGLRRCGGTEVEASLIRTLPGVDGHKPPRETTATKKS
jgi:hypothetical protein